MLKSALAALRLTHLSLALVGLMWVFPFLHVSHAYPLTTFYQEWWSALLGVLAITLLLERDYWVDPAIPRVAQLPVALIAVLVVQWLLGKIVYFDQALLYALYLLLAALLMLLGARLRDRIGLPKLTQALAIALLIGAELSALIGVMQHFGWHTPLDSVIVVKMSAVIYGNLAQPNHFASYIALGLISLGLVWQQKLVKPGYIALLALPMLFVMALSGSRSSWLYLLLMVAMAWWWSHRDASLKPLLRYSLLLIAGFGLMHLVAQLQVVATETGSINTVGRLLNNQETGDIRLYLWHEAGLMFMHFPILGAGFGQFATQHFQLLPELKQSNILGLYNNAHNLIFQLVAETGAIGLLILFASLGVWVNAVRRVNHTVEHWWGYAILGVLAIHSLLEYPLWYSYFLAIAAVLLGMFDETHYRFKWRLAGRVSLASLWLLGLWLLLQLMSGYQYLERAVAASTPATGGAQTASINVREALTSLHHVPLLTPYAELFMSDHMAVDAQYINEKLALNTRVTSFVPISPVVYRQALLLAQGGQLEQAKTIWRQALWSYPESRQHQQEKLAALAAKDPAHFSGLLEFALQKEQERTRAIFHQ
ncbi:MAG: hypothetical protein HOO95_04565 [Gallionella sp.]|nr:hypothetical protein [Gallionella sp.]